MEFFNVKLSISLEGAISIGLVQLPGICLGLYGIYEAFRLSGCSKKGALDALRAFLLFFLPFFIVELVEVIEIFNISKKYFSFESFQFVQFFLSSGINLCCSLLCGKVGEGGSEKFNLLFFIGREDKTGRTKILALDAAKVFFGSVLQLSLQIYFIQVQFVEVEMSQIFSVVSSLLLICKTGYEILSFTADGKMPDYKNTKEKIKGKIMEKVRLIPGLLSWLPLLLSSLVFKMGTINLCILFFGWYSLIIFFGFFIFNCLSYYFAHLDILRKMMGGYKIVHDIDEEEEEEGKKIDVKEMLFTSYGNIFLITRSVSAMSASNLKTAILLQPLQFLLSIIFVVIFKNWDFFLTPDHHPDNLQEAASGLFSTVVILVGLTNLFFTFTSWRCKIEKEKEDPTDIEELEEAVEIEKTQP